MKILNYKSIMGDLGVDGHKDLYHDINLELIQEITK